MPLRIHVYSLRDRKVPRLCSFKLQLLHVRCSLASSNIWLERGHRLFTSPRQHVWSDSGQDVFTIPGRFPSSHLIYPLTARVVGAPQMISQPASSIFLWSPLSSGTWRTPGLSIPWSCLSTSSSVCFVFFPLSLCLAGWFLPDLMNGSHVFTTAVCVSLRWLGGHRVVQLPAGSWYGLPRW